MIATLIFNITVADDATDYDVAIVTARAMRDVAWQVEHGAAAGSIFGKNLETIGMWFFTGEQDADTAGAAAAGADVAGDQSAREGAVTPTSEGQGADPIEADHASAGCQYTSAQAAAPNLELSGYRQCGRRQRRPRE